MAGSALRPLQGGSRRTTLLREPRKPVSCTRTEERHAESVSSREPRAEAVRREVVSAAPPPLPPPVHGGVTISGTSGWARSSMPPEFQLSHRHPLFGSECSLSSEIHFDAPSNTWSDVACIDDSFISSSFLDLNFLVPMRRF